MAFSRTRVAQPHAARVILKIFYLKGGVGSLSFFFCDLVETAGVRALVEAVL